MRFAAGTLVAEVRLRRIAAVKAWSASKKPVPTDPGPHGPSITMKTRSKYHSLGLAVCASLTLQSAHAVSTIT